MLNSLGETILKGLKVFYPVGGLEISDSILRWSLFSKGQWAFSSLKLPPGIISQGRIQNADEFLSALISLKIQITGNKNAKVPAVISLSSVKVYTEALSIPILNEDKMNKALELNLRMSSPMAFEKVYAGRELIRRDEDKSKMDYLASFIEKDVVDDIIKVLRQAGFLTVAVEPRSVSLARLIKKASYFDYNKSYIVMSVDSNGLEFLVIRNGNLYFDYFNTWQDLEQTEKQISLEGFRAVIVRGVNQVLNFYKSQWPEPVDSIMLLSSGLSEEIEKIIQSNFSFKVQEFKFDLGESITNEWAICLGAGLRGMVPRNKDEGVNLMGWGPKEEFRREQIIRFLGFWRILAPSVLGMLLLVLLGSLFILDKSESELVNKPSLKLAPEQLQEVQELERRVQEFNSKITILEGLQSAYGVRMVDIIKELNPILRNNNVSLNRLTNPTGGLLLNGESAIYDNIVNFRKELESNRRFSGVNLPFTNIQQSPQGFAFSVSFNFNPSNNE